MRRCLLLLLLLALPLGAETKITLFHFSDYHSHAEPFYAGEEGQRGGIARAIGYLKEQKDRGGALVFSGGDMINKGSPSWSDKYGCVEWPWLNGVVDAMAFGNHDADYGLAAYQQCKEQLAYPVLSANTRGFRQYAVFDVRGILVGVFAVAGKDFPSLVKVEGLEFLDPVAAARETVQKLRAEGVDVIVMIGHEHAEEDEALARAVPGIDLIFGTHSHIRRDLMQIDGTRTWFLSPGQYLENIARVQLTFDEGKLTNVRGEIVPVTRRMVPDREVASRVRKLQRDLERDPQYAPLFKSVARLRESLPVPQLAARTLDVMRSRTKADVALSTVSSFRHALPAGRITGEQLRAALPYDNEIVVCTMSAAQWTRVVEESAKRKGSDSEAFISGEARGDSVRVATTDYLANVAYKNVFDCAKEKTELRVRTELTATLSP